MEGSIRKSTKLVGFAGALLALSLMAGCGPNQNVVDAQAAAQQADQAASPLPRAASSSSMPRKIASGFERRSFVLTQPFDRMIFVHAGIP